MEELRRIMADLSELQFSMEGLSYIMGVLEESYEYKQEYEMQKNIIIFKLLLDSMSENLSDRVDEIDRFILENRKNWHKKTIYETMWNQQYS